MLPSGWLLSKIASWTRGNLRTAPAQVNIGRIWNASLGRISAIGGAVRPHRLFSAQQSTLPHSKKTLPHHRRLLTLDPLETETMGQEIYDISGLRVAALRTPRNALLSLQYKSRGQFNTRIAFPPATKGVFYYHLSPGSPPQAGEIRFKKCDTVQQFSSGEDLEAESGQPWSVSLLHLVSSKLRKGCLDELLVDAGLVDRELVSDLQRLIQNPKQLTRKVITLHDMDQPFVTNIHLTAFAVRLVTRQSLHFLSIFLWPRASQSPFHGRVRARFELADSPEDKGRLALHLRILDIIKPIEHRIVQNFIAKPRAGELLMKRKDEGLEFTPWCYFPHSNRNTHAAIEQFLKCRAADKAKFGV
ncbi:hypothetical protein M413DRAFT_445270 [Hebeloma cylindrosporum]|uniref:Uncharacterized protein n=1 Tax=Hebeloma cylindrosporum TaxID=76867 RepID=A0A0C2YJN2_HEBCY|nr:hypothetical protein M413DRAFT_445270 [Hebeloma cylindrosporum h7]